MDVRLPDGTVIKGVPDGMSKADLTAKLQANGYDINKLMGDQSVAAPSQAPAPEKQQGFFESIGAPFQAVSEGVIKGGGNIMFGGQRLVGEGLQAFGATQAGQALIADAQRLARSLGVDRKVCQKAG